MTWRWKTSRALTFKPKLTLEHTGYSGDVDWQWCLSFPNKRGGRISSCGLELASQCSPREAIARAVEYLQKIGAEPVTAAEETR